MRRQLQRDLTGLLTGMALDESGKPQPTKVRLEFKWGFGLDKEDRERRRRARAEAEREQKQKGGRPARGNAPKVTPPKVDEVEDAFDDEMIVVSAPDDVVTVTIEEPVKNASAADTSRDEGAAEDSASHKTDR